MTFSGYPCSDGTYCPERAIIIRECKAGYYCNNSETQISCPPAYYCPENSTQPTSCPAGSYCTGNYFDTCNCTDAGAIEPTLCPAGYGEKDGALHTTLDDTCAPCIAGAYSHPNGTGCIPCRAGVVCLDYATTDNPVSNSSDLAYIFGPNGTQSYLCPPGYYCPENSGSATPCPVGTYNREEEKTSVSDCLACPEDHFNHLTGQEACLTCGGEAEQPSTGQPTCICTGGGKDFQESDRRCVCSAGYKEIDGTDDCEKDVYPLCKKGRWRNQRGRCWKPSEFKDHCETNECDSGEYEGYIEQKGVCLCKADDLTLICDLECRIAQQQLLTFVCASAPLEAHIEVRQSDGTVLAQYVESSLTAIINSENAFTSDQCESLDDSSSPVYFTICDSSTDGFLGVYNPDPFALISLFTANIKDNITSNATSDSSNTYSGRRRLLATGTFNGSTFSGIKNPIVCLENGAFMLWAVDNNNYPIYDRNNLFNTNSQFDYGGFRALVEAQALVATSTTLFSYQFKEAGTYVFYSSANQYKKMYISVMQTAAKCAVTGPFFPVTQTNLVANGIGFNQDILQEPDWPVIFVLLGSALVVIIFMIIALLLFRKYGWNKNTYLFPFYRVKTSKYDFDNYASKGSTVYPVRKYHRNMAAVQDGSGVQPLAIERGPVGESIEDDFWDYDRQVDLEGFSSGRVYDTLARQSRNITQTLAKQKEETKRMFQDVAGQTDSLKGMWTAKMNMKGASLLASEIDMADYDRKLHFLEQELQRRKEVGHKYEAILKRQDHLAEEDEKCREDHQVRFQTSLREAVRTLRDHTEKIHRGQVVNTDGQFDIDTHRAVEMRVSTLSDKMSGTVTEECTRIGSWGVLGQGIGGQLLHGSTPMSKQDIFGNSTSIVGTDKATGLLKVKTGSSMLLADGSTQQVPDNNFIHPQTGHVLPIQGNVAFDPIKSRLVCVVDSATGEVPKTDEPYIPFIPYPTRGGQPVKTKLKSLRHSSDVRYGAPMSDPETGLNVPILAVTYHPETHTVLPIGGTHVDIVTGLPTPIEIGSLMVDPNSGVPVPILAVTLDLESGDVVPVGGTNPNNTPILPGETFIEPSSHKRVIVHGGHLTLTHVEASAGGYQSLLDSNVLACEARVNDAVRQYLEALSGCTSSDVDVRQEDANLEKAVKDLEHAREKMKVHLLRTQQDIRRRQERANILATTGGSPGMYELNKSGQLLPILVGTTMPDRSGSGMEVPILGAERHKLTGKVVPLGGTMEDPEGAGLIPINIGNKAVDSITGELSPVIGVRLNAENNTVVPVTLSSGGHRKPAVPAGAEAILEEEIVTRRNYWKAQRKREEELTRIEHKLAVMLLQDVDSVTVKSVSKALEEIDVGANQLQESNKAEVRRRGAAQHEYSNGLPPEVVAVLTDCDSRECETEEGHVAAHVKFADSVRKFFNKLQQEEKKFKDKMDQIEGAMNADGENLQLQRYRQTKNRLLSELQGQIVSRVEHLDQAHSSVEYARQRSELCCQEAKVVLIHSALLAGDYDCQLSGVYGNATDSTVQVEQDSELVPLIKQLIALLESGGPFYLSTDLLNVIKNAAGGGNVHNVNNYNISGQDGKNVTSIGTAEGSSQRDEKREKDASGKDAKKGKATLVKASKEQKDKKSKDEKAATSSDQSASWKELLRKLFEKQAYEAAKLGNDLKSDEMTSMQDVLDDYERKKRNMMFEAKEDLRQKLEKVQSEKERDRIMADYAMNLQKVNDAFDKQKQIQLEGLRKKLLENRRNRKKELYRTHCAEAEAQGVGLESVPDVNIPSHDDMMRDLLRLQENQERSLADIQIQGENARDEVQVPEVDREFEKKINALDVDDTVKSEMIRQARERNQFLQEQIEKMKEALRQRKDRKKPAKLSEEERNGMSAEEQQRLLEAREIQSEADREREDKALLEARKLLEKEQQRLAHEQALRDAMRNKSEEEKDRILAEYQSEMDRLMSRQDQARQSQKDKIVGKLASRKRVREELEKEQAVARELDRITKRHVAQGDSDAADVIMDINEKVNGDKLTSEQQKLLDKQMQEAESVEARQLDEQRDMNQHLDEEMATEEMAVETQIQQQKRLAVAEHRNKFDRDMLLNRQNMTEDEYKRLLAEHQREMAALTANLDQEKDRQKRSIKDRILERRKKRDAQLEEKHRLEMEEEMTRQQQQRDKLNDEISRKVEDSELKKNVQGINGEKAENLIYTVLRQRHLKEAIHLEDQLAREMAAAKRRAKAEVEQSRQKEREILMQAFEQEMMDLVANSKGMSDEELAARKQDLKREQKKQRREFDKLTQQLVEQAEKDITPKMETTQTHQRLELKEKQLQELSDAMQTYNPKDEIKKKYAEDARLAALEAQRFRDEILRRMQEEFDKRRKEEEEREAEKKRKMEEHYKRLEKELEEEQRQEEQRLREREEEKHRLRQKQLEERKRNEEEQIKKSNLSESEKQKLLREHEENMKKLQENFQDEQGRSKSALAAKLEARKKKRHGAEYAKLSKQMLMEDNANQKKALENKQQASNLMGENSAKTETADVLIGNLPTGAVKPESRKQTDLGVPLTGNQEQDWVSMLMASPLFKQISDLEDMLEKSDTAEETMLRPHIKGADYTTPYIDVRDAQWTCKGDLVPVDINSISSSQFVVYRFGVFVIKLLHQQIGTPNVTLLLASNLPPNNYERNAFRNSVFYEHARQILFVRKERIDSIGEFVVLILHSMSHIKCGQMTDDGNAQFLRQFYKCLKVVCQDMFFSRSQSTATAQSLIGQSATNSRPALERALAPLAKKTDEKTNVIGELVDMKVQGPVRLEFSPEHMNQKMYGYDSTSSTARLRQYLASKGGYLATSDFLANRMAELRGSGPVRVTRSRQQRRPPPPPITTQRDVVDSQLADLQSNNDSLNEELSEVLKTEAGLREGIRHMERDPSQKEHVQSANEQLETTLLRKNDLLKRISSVEADILKKEKELKSKKK